MKLVGTGFNSVEGQAQAQQLQVQLRPLLEIVQQAVDLCHGGLASAKVDNQVTDVGQQKVIACVVLARLLEIGEAMVVLAKGGFSVETTSTFRTFLDAYFIFGAVCNDTSFLPRYFNSDLIARDKLMSASSRYSAAPFQLINRYASEEIRNQVKAQANEVSASKFDSYANATSAGCEALYDSQYRIASAATHSTPRSLDAYVIEDEIGTVVELHRHPQLGDVSRRLYDAGHFLLTARSGLDELLGNDASADIPRLRAALEQAVTVE